MKTLQEALSKSMIKKLDKHLIVLNNFTLNDLEDGDIIISRGAKWMFLSNDIIQSRIKEIGFPTDKNKRDIFNKKSAFFVTPAGDKYILYRIPVVDCVNSNGIIIQKVGNTKYRSFNYLIKTNKKYLNSNLTITEIFEKYNINEEIDKLINSK